MDRPRTLTSSVLILAFLVAQIPFSVAEWVAIGVAPEDTGVYSVVIEASYEGYSGSFPIELQVNDTLYTGEGMTVEPVYPIGHTQPITLRYDIAVQNVTVSNDTNFLINNVTVYYLMDDERVLESEVMALGADEEGYWAFTVNLPFAGDYEALVSLLLEVEGEIYGGSFATYFTIDDISEDVSIQHTIDPKVLTPYEEFEVLAEVTFEGDAITSLEDMFYGNIYGTLKELTWDIRDYAYDATFTTPTTEGVYKFTIYAEGQDYIIEDKIYVADTSQAKATRCPLDYDMGCTEMKDVRKCIYDYKSKTLVITEDELIDCFESVNPTIVGSVICEEGYKGDLDGDQEIDLDDLELLQNVVLPLSQDARQDYVDCGDYDLDEDVDEDDLECMTNVVSKKWFGDLNGGVCFDAVYDTALKCDLDDDGFIDESDEQVLDDIIDAADAGIEMAEEILGACDFNQDGSMTATDADCLDYFKGMDLDNPDTLLGYGQTIPNSCMAIYELDECEGIKGDLNGDLYIDALDQILIMLINEKQVGTYDMVCADVNGDGRITDEDVICVSSYFEGDEDFYYYNCLKCDDSLPHEYRNTYEVCNDGYDNDCDGLIDRTSTGGSDECECNENTPCHMKYDGDGGASGGTADGNYQVCRKAGWLVGEESGAVTGGGSAGYQWMNPTDLLCDEGKACEALTCADGAWKCSNDGLDWQWYNSGELPEETDDPEADPVLCEDGYDNDCDGEDIECEEEEEDDDQDAFWLGLAAGFVVGFACPSCSQALSMVSMLGGSFACGEDDKECSQFLTGFGMGSIIGGQTGQWARNQNWWPSGQGGQGQQKPGSTQQDTGAKDLTKSGNYEVEIDGEKYYYDKDGKLTGYPTGKDVPDNVPKKMDFTADGGDFKLKPGSYTYDATGGVGYGSLSGSSGFINYGQGGKATGWGINYEPKSQADGEAVLGLTGRRWSPMPAREGPGTAETYGRSEEDFDF